MAEDVKQEVIKKTQDILGKFIKKPVLTEKLLKKPPFRFLYDICISAMKETGFLEGILNGPEDKIENIKDKEGKIAFLQKVIKAVEKENSIKLAVRPNKVVAGLEATYTNEFLQALGKALENQQSENKNSKTSQPSKTKVAKKSSKEIKEDLDKKKSSSTKISKKLTGSEPNDNSKSNLEKNETSSSPKKKHSNKRIDQAVPKEHIKSPDEKPNEKTSKSEIIERKSPEKKDEDNFIEKISDNRGREAADSPDVDYVKSHRALGQGEQNFDAKGVVQEGEIKKENSGRHKNRRSSIHNLSEETKNIDKPENNENYANGNEILQDNNPASNKFDLLNKSETIINDTNKRPENSSGDIKKKLNTIREGPLISRPRTGIRPVTARPASARPAAPRIRDRGEVSVLEEEVKPASGKLHVIEDKDTNNETEDDNLISVETPNDILIEPAPILLPNTSTVEQEHGHLVEQILEAKKELEDDSSLLLFNEAKSMTNKTEIEWELGRSKEFNNREVEKLRSNIQMLTRSANPLGKHLDFLQEDVDTVQKELESWKEKNANLSLKIAHEKCITDQYMEPLKTHLKELQQSINEQLEQMSIIKANIIRNNNKIQKSLTGF